MEKKKAVRRFRTTPAAMVLPKNSSGNKEDRLKKVETILQGTVTTLAVIFGVAIALLSLRSPSVTGGTVIGSTGGGINGFLLGLFMLVVVAAFLLYKETTK